MYDLFLPPNKPIKSQNSKLKSPIRKSGHQHSCLRLLLFVQLLRRVADQQSAHGQIAEQRHRQHRTGARADPVHDYVLPVGVAGAAPLQCRRQHRIEVAARVVEG